MPPHRTSPRGAILLTLVALSGFGCASTEPASRNLLPPLIIAAAQQFCAAGEECLFAIQGLALDEESLEGSDAAGFQVGPRRGELDRCLDVLSIETDGVMALVTVLDRPHYPRRCTFVLRKEGAHWVTVHDRTVCHGAVGDRQSWTVEQRQVASLESLAAPPLIGPASAPRTGARR